ncbi:MAG: winged helix-turn-helix transcriptional regulator [Candidatus Sericytochromatia bacterium]|nr:winged helix-turn-helix transcriptional regulator [Candidatus Sericytochromatia bacterium]
MKQIRLFKADFFKTLSNPIRIAIIDSLRNGELGVNDLAAVVEADQAYISQQLSILKAKNLVKFRKEGNFVYYSITDQDIFILLDEALRIAKKQLTTLQDSLK